MKLDTRSPVRSVLHNETSERGASGSAVQPENERRRVRRVLRLRQPELCLLFLRNTIKPLSVRDNGDERYKKIGRKMTLTRIKCRNDVSCKSSPVEEFIALACLEVSGMLVEVECPCHTRQLLTNHVLLSTIICELRQSQLSFCATIIFTHKCRCYRRRTCPVEACGRS